MRSVAITGVSGALGRRVVAAMAEQGNWAVTGIDIADFPSGVPKPRRFTVHRADLATVALAELLDGVDAVVHLAAPHPNHDDEGRDDARLTRRLFDAVTAAHVHQVVVVSSATVYGAWPQNPVPLTEDAPVRPNPGFRYAEQKADMEAVAARWLAEHSGTLAVLRPCPTLGHPEARAWLADAVRPTLLDRVLHPLPAMQFVHIDDVAAAVVHATERELNGFYNVGPDDWLTGDEALDLFGPALRLPLPVWGRDALAKAAMLLGPRRQPGTQAYRTDPWVVAIDRLKATGWAPRSSSSEALVASERPSRVRRFAARHRQEVTLAIVGVLGTVVTGVGTWFGMKRRRTR